MENKKEKKTLPVVNENIQGEISGMFNEQKAAAAPVFEIGIKIIQTFNGTRPVVVGEGKSSYARIGTGPLELSKETST